MSTQARDSRDLLLSPVDRCRNSTCCVTSWINTVFACRKIGNYRMSSSYYYRPACEPESHKRKYIPVACSSHWPARGSSKHTEQTSRCSTRPPVGSCTPNRANTPRSTRARVYINHALLSACGERLEMVQKVQEEPEMPPFELPFFNSLTSPPHFDTNLHRRRNSKMHISIDFAALLAASITAFPVPAQTSCPGKRIASHRFSASIPLLYASPYSLAPTSHC